MQCARYQTYGPKEILVVSSGEPVADLIPPAVRHLHLPGNPPIGAMRNIGAQEAQGEAFAHFDDDDYSAPGRLADQIQRLIVSGKQLTGYRSMRFTDGTEWWLYEGTPGYAIGTSLVYWRRFWQENKFPPIISGEDGHLFARAMAAGGVASADAGDLMFATIHSGNTSPRNLTTKQWRKL